MRVMRLVLIKAKPFAPISINALIAIKHPFCINLIGIVKLLLSFPNKFCKFSSLSSTSIPPKVETFLGLSLFPYCYSVVPHCHCSPWLPTHLLVVLALASALGSLASCDLILRSQNTFLPSYTILTLGLTIFGRILLLWASE
jgi:hypothetical protein